MFWVEVYDMNKGLRSGLVLLLLGIISGTLLAFVNYFTAPLIAAAEEKLQWDALKEFYYDVNDPNYDTYDLKNMFDLSKNDYPNSDVSSIFVLKDKTTGDIDALGYLVSADGYSSSSPITMLIVVNNDLTVRGYKVVNHTESPGYGADIVENDFNIQTITDLSGFDAVAGVTFTSDGILRCFELVSERVANDFGGGIQ